MQRLHAVYLRLSAVDPDITAKLSQLRDLSEAVFKDCLADHALPLGAQERRHQKRHRVRGKAGIWPGRDLSHRAQSAIGANAHTMRII